VQNSQRQANHLQILGSGSGRDVSGLGAHVKDDALLQPRNEEMCSLVDDFLLDTRNPIKDDSSRSALDVKDGLADSSANQSRWHRHAVHGVEHPR
jgi:hypothetical protein